MAFLISFSSLNSLTLSSSFLENKFILLFLLSSLFLQGLNNLEKTFLISKISNPFLTKIVAVYCLNRFYLIHFGNIFYYKQYKILQKLGCIAFLLAGLPKIYLKYKPNLFTIIFYFSFY